MNLKNLYAQSAAGANLTPVERALLRLVEGLIATALVAALPFVASALATGAPDWGATLKAAIAAAATAVMLALSKWAKAQGDAPLPVTPAASAASFTAASVPMMQATQPSPDEMPTLQVRAVPMPSTTSGL